MKPLLPFLLCITPLFSRAQTPLSVQIDGLFTEQSIRSVVDVCETRFPVDAAPWKVAFAEWRDRNSVELNDARALVVRIEGRFHGPEIGAYGSLPSPFGAFELQSIVLPLASFASANDQAAKASCEGIVGMLTGKLVLVNLEKSKRAAQDLLALPTTP